MFSRLLNRLWPISRRRARRVRPPRCRPVLEALEDRCVPALVPPSLTLSSFQEFALPTADSHPDAITAGPDGNLWFTEVQIERVGLITPQGAVTEFPVSGVPRGITAGPDGNLWFTEGDNHIGRITPAGTVTEFPLPGASEPSGITAGPDGNLWFTEFRGGGIGRITPAGQISEFLLSEGSHPIAITAGPDGNLWFTDGSRIGRITPQGAVTQFSVTTGDNLPLDITAGPDGNLWFTEEFSTTIGRITPAGTVTEFPAPSGGTGITRGADGNLWFTTGNEIARITTTGAVTEFPIPTANSDPTGITLGPDGNLWFTEYVGNRIGRLQVTVEEDVTGQLHQLPVKSLPVLRGRVRVRLRFVNQGGALEGPLWLVLTGLRRKVQLRHASGLTAHLFPGSPFVDVLAAGAVLPPGGMLTVPLLFRDPTGAPVHFAAHLVDGGEVSLNPQPLPPGEQP